MKVILVRNQREGERKAYKIVREGYVPLWRSTQHKYWTARREADGELVKVQVVRSGRDKLTGRVS